MFSIFGPLGNRKHITVFALVAGELGAADPRMCSKGVMKQMLVQTPATHSEARKPGQSAHAESTQVNCGPRGGTVTNLFSPLAFTRSIKGHGVGKALLLSLKNCSFVAK